MKSKAYITYYRNQLLTALYEDNQLVELFADDLEKKDLLDRIYIGKVKNIVTNIDAAFVDIGGGIEGYYSLKENTNHLFVSPKNGTKLVPGDEILVQVNRENIKTKAPALTSHMTLAGKYMVLKYGKNTLTVSSKITDSATRKRLKTLFTAWTDETTGFVIRTDAANADDAALYAECQALREKLAHILKRSKMLACYSEVYREPEGYIRRLTSLENSDFEKIETDIPEVYAALKTHHVGDMSEKGLILYEDTTMPLCKLLSLETHIERVLNPKVWLKSGGFLVISITEALTVIDVNTGKYTGKKAPEDTFYKINIDAADEIARQLRLRNLSGIIIIDFIDMKDHDRRTELLQRLKHACSPDPMRPVVLDITKLGLVEMTRRKERRPLHEQLMHVCPKCKGLGWL